MKSTACESAERELLREARGDLKRHRHAGGEPDYCATCELIERIDALLATPERVITELDQQQYDALVRDAMLYRSLARRAVPAAWIEHHKGGDNLNWERVDHPYAKATPLYKLPPPEQRGVSRAEQFAMDCEGYAPTQPEKQGVWVPEEPTGATVAAMQDVSLVLTERAQRGNTLMLTDAECKQLYKAMLSAARRGK